MPRKCERKKIKQKESRVRPETSRAEGMADSPQCKEAQGKSSMQVSMRGAIADYDQGQMGEKESTSVRLNTQFMEAQTKAPLPSKGLPQTQSSLSPA